MDTPFTDRLLAATNAHDVDAIVACFAEGTSTRPVPPSARVRGQEQVRANWTSILGAVPDLVADVAATATSQGVE